MKSLLPLVSASLLLAALAIPAQEPAAENSDGQYLPPSIPTSVADEQTESATFSTEERAILRDLALDLAAGLRESAIPKDAPLALLPVIDDRADFAYGLFKIAATDAKCNVVEGRDDPMWETIVNETAWTQRKGSVGVLDAATLTSFGKLQAANLLLYGNVRTVRTVFGLTRVEAELHVSSVQTKQHLWGRSFVRQEPMPWLLIGVAAAVVLLIVVLFLRAATRVR